MSAPACGAARYLSPRRICQSLRSVRHACGSAGLLGVKVALMMRAENTNNSECYRAE